MKKLFLLFSLLISSFGIAQQYSVDWYKISGGGGISSNGQYSVTGTIGQPDASTAFGGGNYSVTGGFWGLVAVQTPGAPALRIFLTSSNSVVLAWPLSAGSYTLQWNSNLATTNWINFAGSVVPVGDENLVVIWPPTGSQFFRLH